ncbi:hypothetical protein ACE1YR_13125 [Pseudomonas sp. K1(2024)]|uniref:Uncharacterized protein n=1 Tax=Pseudomonas boreofloridensis TaxID=3064348 RepID=A0ABV4ZA24_9PSED|nr:hypothetical protein [Pseudomonas sp. K13]MDO7902974.1 hypothetical protein [Pseudomonas sp. K13]
MNNFSEIDEVRKLFATIVREKLPEVELEALKVSYHEDLSLLLAKGMDQLTKNIRRLASSGGDALATQSALIHLRAHAMSLCSFFDNIAEDAEYLLLEPEWPDIPEE